MKARYDHLLGTERPEIVEIVSWAAGNGDRSENGDYLYGRKRMREIDRELGTSLAPDEGRPRHRLPPNNPTSRAPSSARGSRLPTRTIKRRWSHWSAMTNRTQALGRIGWSSPLARALKGAAHVGDLRVREASRRRSRNGK